MTRKEAIICLKGIKNVGHDIFTEQKDFQESLDMAIKALEQEPCEDCISRQAVINHICEGKECYKDDCKGRIYKRCFDLQWIYDLPPVTPEQKKEVKA